MIRLDAKSAPTDGVKLDLDMTKPGAKKLKEIPAFVSRFAIQVNGETEELSRLANEIIDISKRYDKLKVWDKITTDPNRVISGTAYFEVVGATTNQYEVNAVHDLVEKICIALAEWTAAPERKPIEELCRK